MKARSLLQALARILAPQTQSASKPSKAPAQGFLAVLRNEVVKLFQPHAIVRNNPTAMNAETLPAKHAKAIGIVTHQEKPAAQKPKKSARPEPVAEQMVPMYPQIVMPQANEAPRAVATPEMPRAEGKNVTIQREQPKPIVGAAPKEPVAMRSEKTPARAETPKPVLQQPSTVRHMPPSATSEAGTPRSVPTATVTTVEAAPSALPLRETAAATRAQSPIASPPKVENAVQKRGSLRTPNILHTIQNYWQRYLRVEKNTSAPIATAPNAPVPASKAAPMAARADEPTLLHTVAVPVNTSAPLAEKPQTSPSERLGGTEAIPQKNDRWKPVAAQQTHVPRSFWGVKVVGELRQRPLEDKPQSTAPPKDVSREKPLEAARPSATQAHTGNAEKPADPIVRGERPRDHKPQSVPIPVRESAPNAQKLEVLPPQAKQNELMPKQTAEKAEAPVHAAQAPITEPPREKEPLQFDANLPRADFLDRPSAPQEKHTEIPKTTEDIPAPPTQPSAAREFSEAPPVAAGPLRGQFTLEQIKELQNMVSKRLQGARTMVDGGREAVFNWNHDTLGPLSFRIISRNDDVEIHIGSGSQDVADALKEGRGTVERMIADIGLKVERFEVQVRSETAQPDLAGQTHEREHPDRGRQPESDFADGGGLGLDIPTEEEAPHTASSLAEREWVA